MSAKCFTCSVEVLIQDGKNIFSCETIESCTPIYELLKRFSDEIEIEDDAVICENCYLKLNEYDNAFCTVKRIQNEFLQFLCNKTENSVNNENSDEILSINDDSDMFIEEKFDKTKTEFINLEEEIVYVISSDDIKIKNENSEEEVYELQFLEKEDNLKNGVIIQEIQKKPKHCDLSIEKLGNLSPNIEKELNKSTNKKGKSCKICNEHFSSDKEYNKHRRKEHAKTKHNYVCHICGANYKARSTLNFHLSIHRGERPYKCEICGKNFSQKVGLARHMPLHTGEKPFQCEKCGKQFIHYSSFRMHNFAHNDIRNKKCEICGLQLRSSSHLNRHMLVHTGLKPHSCPICEQRFAQRYNMMSHLRSNHQGIPRKKNTSSASKKNKTLNHKEQDNLKVEELKNNDELIQIEDDHD